MPARLAGGRSNQAAAEKIKAKYEKQRASINTKLMKEELELDKDDTLNQRKMEKPAPAPPRPKPLQAAAGAGS